MRTYDQGHKEEKDKGKANRKKGNSGRQQVFRYIASLSNEQISRMMKDGANQFSQTHVDQTGRAILRKSIEQQKMFVQAKLEISQPHDSSEMQADKLADAVSRGDVNMSRMTMEQAGPEISMKGENGTLTTTPEFDQQLSATKGQGQSLDGNTKGELEQHTGTDLSGVKIHTGSTASSMSEGINAKAFTHGQDIYFKGGNYNPGTAEGKSLLAHEVTHTVQQGKGVMAKIQRKVDPAVVIKEFLELLDGDPELKTLVTNTFGTDYKLDLYEDSCITSAGPANEYVVSIKERTFRLQTKTPRAAISVYVLPRGAARSIMVTLNQDGRSLLMDAGAPYNLRVKDLTEQVQQTAKISGSQLPFETTISHFDKDHFSELDRLKLLPGMENMVVRVARYKYEENIKGLAAWKTAYVQRVAGENILEIRVEGGDVNMTQRVMNGLKMIEMRLNPKNTEKMTVNETSPITILYDLSLGTSMVFTSDLTGKGMEKIINAITPEVMIKLMGAGGTNLRVLEHAHHGGKVGKGDVKGMIELLRLSFEASGGNLNMFAQQKAGAESSPSGTVTILQEAEIIKSEPVTENSKTKKYEGGKKYTVDFGGLFNRFYADKETITRMQAAQLKLSQLQEIHRNITMLKGILDPQLKQEKGGGKTLLSTYTASLADFTSRLPDPISRLKTSINAFWLEMIKAGEANPGGLRSGEMDMTQVTAAANKVEQAMGKAEFEKLEKEYIDNLSVMTFTQMISFSSAMIRDATARKDLGALAKAKAYQMSVVQQAGMVVGTTFMKEAFQYAMVWAKATLSMRNKLGRTKLSSGEREMQLYSRTVQEMNRVTKRQVELEQMVEKSARTATPSAGTKGAAWFFLIVQLLDMTREYMENEEIADAMEDIERSKIDLAGQSEIRWWKDKGIEPGVMLLDDDNEQIAGTENMSNEDRIKAALVDDPRFANITSVEGFHAVVEGDLTYDNGGMEAVFYDMFAEVLDLKSWFAYITDESGNRRLHYLEGKWGYNVWLARDEKRVSFYSEEQQEMLDGLYHLARQAEQQQFDMMDSDEELFSTDESVYTINRYFRTKPIELDEAETITGEKTMENRIPMFRKAEINYMQSWQPFRDHYPGDPDDYVLVQAADAYTLELLMDYYIVTASYESMETSGTHTRYNYALNTGGYALVNVDDLRSYNSVLTDSGKMISPYGAGFTDTPYKKLSVIKPVAPPPDLVKREQKDNTTVSYPTRIDTLPKNKNAGSNETAVNASNETLSVTQPSAIGADVYFEGGFDDPKVLEIYRQSEVAVWVNFHVSFKGGLGKFYDKVPVKIVSVYTAVGTPLYHGDEPYARIQLVEGFWLTDIELADGTKKHKIGWNAGAEFSWYYKRRWWTPVPVVEKNEK